MRGRRRRAGRADRRDGDPGAGHHHRHARARRSGCPPRRDPRQHAGHADERQFRRLRPDRPGRPREFQGEAPELLFRADVGGAQDRAPRPTASRSTGSCCATACITWKRATRSAWAMPWASCPNASASGSFRGSRSASSSASCSPRASTLLDKGHLGELGVSHLAARQELREMIAGLALPMPSARTFAETAA